MYSFRFSKDSRPSLHPRLTGQGVLILRAGQKSVGNWMTYGRLRDWKIRTNHGSYGRQFFETTFMLGTNWVELADGDDVYIYNQDKLTLDDTALLQKAISEIVMGKAALENDVNAAVQSILGTFSQ